MTEEAKAACLNCGETLLGDFFCGLAIGYALAFSGTVALLVLGTLSLFQPAP